MKRSGFKRKKSKHDWREMLSILHARSKGHCERCDRYIHVASLGPSNVHHHKPRSKGGSDHPSNLHFFCGPLQFYGKLDESCHTWVEMHKREAREEGWLE